MAARLNHDNVIKVFDLVQHRGCPWIVMELLSCRSLQDVIKEEGPLSPARAAQAGLEILAALRAAHAAGIVHRDVKPANILMAPDRAVLTDFGIARAAGSAALTLAGVLIGSPPYIAPERAMRGLSGPPGDLWGLGACLYAAVEGQGPFDRDAGALASLTAVVADEPPPATHAGSLWPVISGLLRKDPAERLDAAQAGRMLLAVATPAASRRHTAATATWRSRILATGLVGLTVLAALAASGTAVTLVSTGPPSHVMAPAAAIAPSAVAGAPVPAAVIPRVQSARPGADAAHAGNAPAAVGR